MLGAATANPRDESPSNATTPAVPWTWAAACVAFLFVICEHNLTTSTHIAFTQTADEMIDTASGGNTIRRLCFMALAAAGTFALFAHGGSKWRSPGILAGLVSACLGLCTLSLTWSDEPSMTVRRLMVLYFFLMGAFGLARLYDCRDLCRIILVVTTTTALMGIMAEIGLRTFRPWSGEYRFSGSLHPNTQGAYLAAMALSAMLLAIVDGRRRWLYGCAIAFALVMLYLTKSRTSFAGVSLMLVLTFLAYLPGNWKIAIPLIGLWMGISGLTAILLVDEDGEKKLSKIAMMGREEESDGLTGRTTIWPAVMYFIQKRPVLGYGYESFWTPDHIETVSKECEWGVREAHNAYLEATLMCGVVGAVLFVLTVITGLLSAYGNYAKGIDPCVLFWFGYPLNGLFNGLCESGMMMIAFPTFLIVVGFFRLGFVASATRAIADERDRAMTQSRLLEWIDQIPRLIFGASPPSARPTTAKRFQFEPRRN